jgi:hypothetical protein
MQVGTIRCPRPRTPKDLSIRGFRVRSPGGPTRAGLRRYARRSSLEPRPNALTAAIAGARIVQPDSPETCPLHQGDEGATTVAWLKRRPVVDVNTRSARVGCVPRPAGSTLIRSRDLAARRRRSTVAGLLRPERSVLGGRESTPLRRAEESAESAAIRYKYGPLLGPRAPRIRRWGGHGACPLGRAATLRPVRRRCLRCQTGAAVARVSGRAARRSQRRGRPADGGESAHVCRASCKRIRRRPAERSSASQREDSVSG